ncbi:protein kinase domain-containing protein [Simkania sp.]|uniref:protein kinase domain-containing protein n=1 Tax=Simkania sp. TaxID=34094 RepID=UPI003B518B98
MMKAYSHNFGEIDWANISNPTQYLIRMTGLVTQALSVVHSVGDVHRDVKEGNVMVDEKETDSPDSIKLIDYDTVKPSSSEPVYIMATVEYLNPSSFGNTQETLINQRSRRGLQRPCDDMFAFFHMGIRMTLQLCKELIPKTDRAAHQDIQALYEPTILNPEDGLIFSDMELKELGEKYAKHHIYYTHSMFPQSVAILPSAEIYMQTLPKILVKLPLLDASQQLLEEYVTYCIDQKFSSDIKRHGATTANLALQRILTPPVEASDNRNVLKRRRIQEESPKTLPPISPFLRPEAQDQKHTV